MASEKLTLDHFKKVAQNSGLQANSTMEDPYIRESEVGFILEAIETYINRTGPGNQLSLLDVGCGNGYLLSVISERFPDLALYGVEFTPELYKLAQSRAIRHCSITNGDIRKADCFAAEFKVDIVITERVIINILKRKDQYLALRHIFKMMKLNGTYIMIESFTEPLVELQQARKEMCLGDIAESYQNKYLNEHVVTNLKKYGMQELRSKFPINYLSTHFYITRVVHKAIRPEGGKVKFSRFSNFFRMALPQGIGNYSPILFRVFEKIKAWEASSDTRSQ